MAGGINATRLFSVLYHRTLNVGRVVSPTLALLVQREAEIGAFKPEPYYTAELDFGSLPQQVRNLRTRPKRMQPPQGWRTCYGEVRNQQGENGKCSRTL